MTYKAQTNNTSYLIISQQLYFTILVLMAADNQTLIMFVTCIHKYLYHGGLISLIKIKSIIFPRRSNVHFILMVIVEGN
jgi:hypothetical protein